MRRERSRNPGQQGWKLAVRRAREGGAGPEPPSWAPTHDEASRLVANVKLAAFREALARWAVDLAGPPPAGWHVVVQRETAAWGAAAQGSAWPDGWVVGLTRRADRATIVLDRGARAT